jgi:hypothetical protein
MSEENENSDREEKEENSEKEDKEENEHKENFTSYEDELITLLNKLSETIETFNTLSREQAEKAILETNIKINNCKDILEKMEEYINNLKGDDEEKTELNKKLLNYKTEYHEILNKFKEIQDNYINRKTENALMDDQNASNLIDEDETKNRVSAPGPSGAGDPYAVDGQLDETQKKAKKENKKEEDNKNEINNIKLRNQKNNNKSNNNNEITLISVTNNENIALDHNNSNYMGYALNANKEKEETFHRINQDYDKKKKKSIFICVCLCVFIFFLIFLIAILSI